ncbi:CARDB domain-containing protein [Fulvivirgaceae bacterium BMA10]|uniref:CARDB domain-containing protein n=1 Tax=Splendidivirga corallicola TaxID=3051826 RepID=A0ABT8KQ79_9BACT|nr:CARDB domain-containing protein [Fulvivirgaceae bacterium BMA10]
MNCKNVLTSFVLIKAFLIISIINAYANTPNKPDRFRVKVISAFQIDLTWRDRANNEDFYIVERSLDKENFIIISVLDRNIEAFSDFNVEANTTYYYRVKARNIDVNGVIHDSNYTGIKAGTTPNAIPKAPTDLTVETLSQTELSLTWKDNSNNETHFIIERSMSGSDVFVVIGRVDKDVTVFTDTGLSSNTTYFYRVSAINELGSSDYSNESSAITLQYPPTLDDIADPEPIQVNEGPQTILLTGITAGPGETQNLTITTNSDNPSLISSIQTGEISSQGTSVLTYESETDQHGQAVIAVTVTDDGPGEFPNVNFITKSFTVVVLEPKADLLISDVSLSSLDLLPGEQFDIQTTVLNQGNAPSEANKLRYYLSYIDQDDIGDEIGSSDVGSLAIGGSVEISETLTLPHEIEEGQYILTCYADADDDIDESDEDNNTYEIELNVRNLPDLSHIDSSVDPPIVGIDQDVHLATTIVNIGTENSEECALKYFISADDNFDTSDVELGEASLITTLEPSETLIVNKTITIPSSITEGDYFIIFYADANETVGEHNELNNFSTVGIKILSELPPVITATNFPEFKYSDEDNSLIDITAEDDEEVVDVKFHYRSIRDSNWNSSSVNPNGSNYQVSVPESIFDELGLEYYFEVFDNVGLKTTSDTAYTYLSYKNEGLSLPYLSFGDQIENYRMIAVPLELENNSVQNSLEDDLGNYDPSKWRLFQYPSGEYKEGFNNLEPGKGYWMIVRNQQDIDTGKGNVVKANQSKPYSVHLKPGWNQIGNPYNFDLLWSEILAHNGFPSGVSGNIKIYDNGYQNSDLLQKFEGGFVFADEAITLEFPLTFPEGIQTSNRSSSNPPKSEVSPSWIINFNLRSDKFQNSISGFGMHELASEGVDPMDEVDLPNFEFMRDLRLTFKNNYQTDVDLTRDIVPFNEHHIWNLILSDTKADQEISLSWNIVEEAEAFNKQLILYDPVNEMRIDMLHKNQYNFKGDHNVFKIFYGSPEFIERNLQPQSISLGAAYPNPFNHMVQIPFTLHKSNMGYTVAMSIHSVSGQHVKTLIEGNFDEGFHQVNWDATDGSGKSVNPGLYFYKLDVKQNNLSKQLIGRLILLK